MCDQIDPDSSGGEAGDVDGIASDRLGSLFRLADEPDCDPTIARLLSNLETDLLPYAESRPVEAHGYVFGRNLPPEVAARCEASLVRARLPARPLTTELDDWTREFEKLAWSVDKRQPARHWPECHDNRLDQVIRLDARPISKLVRYIPARDYYRYFLDNGGSRPAALDAELEDRDKRDEVRATLEAAFTATDHRVSPLHPRSWLGRPGAGNAIFVTDGDAPPHRECPDGPDKLDVLIRRLALPFYAHEERYAKLGIVALSYPVELVQKHSNFYRPTALDACTFAFFHPAPTGHSAGMTCPMDDSGGPGHRTAVVGDPEWVHDNFQVQVKRSGVEAELVGFFAEPLR